MLIAALKILLPYYNVNIPWYLSHWQSY